MKRKPSAKSNAWAYRGIRRNLKKKSSRAFWVDCEKAAAEIADWPAWKRAGINVDQLRPSKLAIALAAWARWYSARLDRIARDMDRGVYREDYHGCEQDLFEALGCLGVAPKEVEQTE